ncbi:MAG: filamentous hemagglutinin N-terminal domain-containing protein [Rhodospirillaceae bacterium]
MTITQTSPTRVDINQTSARGIINWQSFSIGNGEHTNFNQPSSSAITLNRVVGGKVSEILGRLTANGHVWLVNPNGVFFGPNAQIDVAGLVATTHNIKNEDFMAGRYVFQSDTQPAGIIENQGNITAADAGLVALVAPGVVNHGVINARLGEVTLASGNQFTVDFYGDQKINLALDKKTAGQVVGRDGKPVGALVKNDGKIFADGGTVQLTAAVAKGVVDNAINVGGAIQARSVEQKNGKIILYGDGGKVEVSGTLDASGKTAGQTGGTVTASADKLILRAGAKVDVSGAAGGGEALIGGDFRGGKATAAEYEEFAIRPARKPVPPAQVVYVDRDASIIADALDSGKGGKVVVWADDTTRTYGTISVRGGVNGGNGGFIETSGHALFTDGIRVNAKSFSGSNGNWLLDPYDINIMTAGGGTLPYSLSDVDGSINNSLTYEVPPSMLLGWLTNSNVTLQASHDILVGIDLNNTSTNSLIFNAGHGIVLNGDISSSGGLTFGGPVTYSANHLLSASGSSNIDFQGNVTGSSGAVLTVNAGGNLNMASGKSFSTGGANLNLTGGTLTLAGIDVGSGLLELTTLGTASQQSALKAGSLYLGGTGGIYNLTNTGNNVTTLSANTDTVRYSSNSPLLIGSVSGVDGIMATGQVTLVTNGLTLDKGITASGTGDEIILSVGNSFVNNVGGSGLVPNNGGRFLVYTTSTNTFGSYYGQLSAKPYYNFGYMITPFTQAQGNRFIYGNLAPTLTLTADSFSRSDTDTSPINYTFSHTGLIGGDTLNMALTGSPDLSSTATPGMGAGSYPISISRGSSLISDFGYKLTFANGTLTITSSSGGGTSGGGTSGGGTSGGGTSGGGTSGGGTSGGGTSGGGTSGGGTSGGDPAATTSMVGGTKPVAEPSNPPGTVSPTCPDGTASPCTNYKVWTPPPPPSPPSPPPPSPPQPSPQPKNNPEAPPKSSDMPPAVFMPVLKETPTINQIVETPKVQETAKTVATAIQTGSVYETIAAMGSSGNLSAVEQMAVFKTVPTQSIVSGLLSSNNAMAQAVGAELKQVAAGNLGVTYADMKNTLQANGATGDIAKTYLGLFQAVQKEAKTAAFGGALKELSTNSSVADVVLSGPGAPSQTSGPASQNVAVQQVTVMTDSSGRPVIKGRIENWATGFELSARDMKRLNQVADLGGGSLDDLIGAGPTPGSMRLYAELPADSGGENRIKGWNGGRQARIEGKWVFVRDDGSFEIVLPRNSNTGEVKLTLIDEHGLVKQQTIKIDQPTAQADSLPKPAKGRKIAVLFANTDYHNQEAIPNLDTPGRDASLISGVLKNKYGFEAKIVENATKQKIADTLRILHNELGENDQLLIYYAGHGYLNEKTGVGYWLPTDATAESAKNWVSTNDVAKLLRWIPARNIMMIADSCYSGSFTKEQNVEKDGRPTDPKELRELRGVMAMSSGGDEPVLDGEINSPFAKALANRLNKVSAAAIGEELFRQVRDDVTATTPQTPQYGAISSAGYDHGADYVFETRSKRAGAR